MVFNIEIFILFFNTLTKDDQSQKLCQLLRNFLAICQLISRIRMPSTNATPANKAIALMLKYDLDRPDLKLLSNQDQ